MQLGTLLVIAGAVAVLGFIVFAFRQGLRVKPIEQPDHFPPSGK
jgi:hypothetical protein